MSCSSEVTDMRELYLAGKRTWPSFSVSFEAFSAHWASLRLTGEEPAQEPADLYLCCACAAGDPDALRCFERANASVAEAAIRRVDHDEDFVGECLQELWKSLLLGDRAKVRSFSARGLLKAWVRVAAMRVAFDRRRAEKRLARRQVGLNESLAAPEASHEAALLKARFGQAFQTALHASVARLSEQERNVLRLHVVSRFSIDQIGLAYAVHRATAARWIERARTRIYDDVRRALGQSHGLTQSEFRSLAVQFGAEIELSLGFTASAKSQDGAA